MRFLTILVVGTLALSCSNDCKCPDCIVSTDQQIAHVDVRLTSPSWGDTVSVAGFEVVLAFPTWIPVQTVQIWGTYDPFAGPWRWANPFYNPADSGSVIISAVPTGVGTYYTYAQLLTTGGESYYSNQVMLVIVP